MPRLTSRLAAVPPLVWLLLLTLACLVPFIGRAFFIDDTLFLRAAEQIRRHPADFYGFQINWFGDTTAMIDAFDNPPLTCYYMAMASMVAGWSERAMHAAFLLPALAAVWGIYSLAKLHCSRPALATLVTVLTPVFLISGTTVMCDVMFLACWVWSLVFFERGLREKMPSAYLLAGVCAGLAVLTKFTGLALIPLLGAYGLARNPKIGWWMVAPLLPLLFAGAYELYTHHIYGRGLLFSAAGYATQYYSNYRPWEKEVIGLSFVGGCFLPLAFFAPWLWSFRSLLVWVILIGICPLLLVHVSHLEPYLTVSGRRMDWVMCLQDSLYVITGLQILLIGGIDFWRRRDSGSLLLVCWMWGIFVFAAAINWTVNGRSLLPMAPAVGILMARRLDLQKSSRFKLSWRWLMWPLLGAAWVSLLLVQADCNMANTQRTAAMDSYTRFKKPGNNVWFEGHWGFQYYLENFGARAFNVSTPQWSPGDVLVIPFNAYGTQDPPPPAHIIAVLQYLPNKHCATMDLWSGAGFYTATYGPLPFIFMPSLTSDHYYVYQADK